MASKSEKDVINLELQSLGSHYVWRNGAIGDKVTGTDFEGTISNIWPTKRSMAARKSWDRRRKEKE